MTSGRTHALQTLTEADSRLDDACQRRLSLAPGRERATRLARIGADLLPEGVAPRTARAFAKGLAEVVCTQCEHFPDNIFFDWDFPALHLYTLAARDEEELDTTIRLLVDLQVLFGSQRGIQFRYTHDFIYGFDWARWVARDPEARALVGPFDEPFLEYLIGRGHELIALIREDDETYPTLAQGVDRNPFAFPRDPSSEAILHRDLAERGLVPVEAWRYDASPTWDRPYQRLREERAVSLGLAGAVR